MGVLLKIFDFSFSVLLSGLAAGDPLVVRTGLLPDIFDFFFIFFLILPLF
jgi:hypothetical protein